MKNWRLLLRTRSIEIGLILQDVLLYTPYILWTGGKRRENKKEGEMGWSKRRIWNKLCNVKVICVSKNSLWCLINWCWWVQWEDVDTVHNSTWNPHYSFKFSSINFISILYFNSYFKPCSFKVTIFHLCIGFSYLWNIYFFIMPILGWPKKVAETCTSRRFTAFIM